MILGILLLIITLYMLVKMVWPMTWTTTASGKTYYVKKGKHQKSSAETLHTLTQRLQRFIEEADNMYPGDPRIENIRSRWDGTLGEVGYGDDIAYSVNKTKIYICIRSPKGTLEGTNSSMYVLLHEVAHIATNIYGHPPSFWKNFRWLLEVAERLGMYTYEDFDQKQITHCGHTLGNNVMKCLKSRPKTCKSLLR